MTKSEFIEEVEFILNEESGSLKETTELKTLRGFDSTGLLGLIAFFDSDLESRVDVDALRASETVADLLRLAGDKVK